MSVKLLIQPLIVDTSGKKEKRKLQRRETNKYQRAERTLMEFIDRDIEQ